MNINQLKRPSSISDFPDSVRSKFKGNKSIMHIENIPNELFYEIFSYINSFDLYKTFSNLNMRFQHLLATSFLTFKIDLLSSSSKLDLQHLCKHIVKPNRQRIVSLCLKRIWNDSSIFTIFTINSSFSRLESLAVYGIRSYDILLRLSGLTSLPRLSSFTLDIEDNDTDWEDFGNIYRFIFSLTTLKYNKVFSKTNLPLISLTIATNIQFTTIEYLNIQHSCKLDDLITMLSYTPRLCHLTCKEVIGSVENIDRMSLSLPNLTHISIKKFRLQFYIFEVFIKKICSQLQKLCITTYQDEAYLDADRWERLIREHIPHLNRFHFDHQIFVYHRFSMSSYYRGINRFISPFWIERGWIFQLKIDIEHDYSAVITYSIHSYKKKWNELSEFIKIDAYSNQSDSLNHTQQIVSSTQLSQNIELTLMVPFYNTCDRLFTDDIISLFTIIRITHLEVPYNRMFIGTLINFIRLLPNLDSLRVWSLSLLKPRCLSLEEAITLRLVSNKNKITKVNIQWMTELAQLQFLFDLCPHMQYLEIDCSNNADLQLLIRFILMKHVRYIPYLYVLCFCFQKLNDKKVEKLQAMINFEKLCYDYTIKRIGNKIYLHWKRQ